MAKKLISWDYANLAGAQLEAGVITGVVSLQGQGIEAWDFSIWRTRRHDSNKAPYALEMGREHFEQAHRAVPVLRQLISENQVPSDVASPSTASDPMDQIRKLGELRDSGLLTDEELRPRRLSYSPSCSWSVRAISARTRVAMAEPVQPPARMRSCCVRYDC